METVHFPRVRVPSLLTVSEPGKAQPGAFAGVLAQAVERVGALQADADQELRRLLHGEPVELHRVLLAGERAGLASQLMMSVRNKLVEAYQEIMRIQV